MALSELVQVSAGVGVIVVPLLRTVGNAGFTNPTGGERRRFMDSDTVIRNGGGPPVVLHAPKLDAAEVQRLDASRWSDRPTTALFWSATMSPDVGRAPAPSGAVNVPS